ncbi:MAG: TPM domain-containing protein [Phycisphaeraceae bacterium JB051]
MPRSLNPNQFLTPDERKQLTDAVQEAESKTSSQIKVVLLRHCWGKLTDKASSLFIKYGLDQLPDRNGVLILLVLTNRELLIYGDEGINDKVDDDFWTNIHDQMTTAFKNNDMGTGLEQGIQQIGKQLAIHFPRGLNHENTVDDQPVFEK